DIVPQQDLHHVDGVVFLGKGSDLNEGPVGRRAIRRRRLRQGWRFDRGRFGGGRFGRGWRIVRGGALAPRCRGGRRLGLGRFGGNVGRGDTGGRLGLWRRDAGVGRLAAQRDHRYLGRNAGDDPQRRGGIGRDLQQ